MVHLDIEGVYSFNGRFQPSPSQIDLSPNLSGEAALAITQGDLGKRHLIRPIASEIAQLFEDDQQTNLCLLPVGTDGKQTHLVWKISLHANLIDHWHYFIDAQNGQILKRYNSACSFGPKLQLREI